MENLPLGSMVLVLLHGDRIADVGFESANPSVVKSIKQRDHAQYLAAAFLPASS